MVNVKLILSLLLMAVLIMSGGCGGDNPTKSVKSDSTGSEESANETDLLCSGNCQHKDIYTGLDFKDSIVVVIIQENSNMRDFSVNDFEIVNAKEIIWIAPSVPNNIAPIPFKRPILHIVLKQPGRQNVICAVQLLETLDYVYAAEPDFDLIACPDFN